MRICNVTAGQGTFYSVKKRTKLSVVDKDGNFAVREAADIEGRAGMIGAAGQGAGWNPASGRSSMSKPPLAEGRTVP